jgi:4-amino-4-deoxy-L-arabinose transferase-like glycosyltransferase
MLTLNSFNERKIYGICQGYNIDIGIERLPYRCTWSMLLAHSFGRVRVTHLLLLFCVLFSVSQCYWLFLSPFFLLRLCSFKNWLLILDVTLTVVTLVLLSPKPQRKRTDTANVMDATITKNDNSKTFRGHLKGLY